MYNSQLPMLSQAWSCVLYRRCNPTRSDKSRMEMLCVPWEPAADSVPFHPLSDVWKEGDLRFYSTTLQFFFACRLLSPARKAAEKSTWRYVWFCSVRHVANESERAFWQAGNEVSCCRLSLLKATERDRNSENFLSNCYPY